MLAARFQAFEKSRKRTLKLAESAPLPGSDRRGTAVVSLTLVMVVGGYLGSTVLALLLGRPATRQRGAASRLLLSAGYSIAGGLAVVLLSRLTLGVRQGHEVQAVAAAALICFAAGNGALT